MARGRREQNNERGEEEEANLQERQGEEEQEGVRPAQHEELTDEETVGQGVGQEDRGELHVAEEAQAPRAEQPQGQEERREEIPAQEEQGEREQETDELTGAALSELQQAREEQEAPDEQTPSFQDIQADKDQEPSSEVRSRRPLGIMGPLIGAGIVAGILLLLAAGAGLYAAFQDGNGNLPAAVPGVETPTQTVTATPVPSGQQVIIVMPPNVTPVFRLETPTPTAPPKVVYVNPPPTPTPESFTPTATSVPAPNPTGVPASSTSTAVKIQVVNNKCEGTGIAGAKVVIWDETKTSKVGEGITDASGVTHIAGAAPGMKFVAEVFAVGYPTPVYPIQQLPDKQDPFVRLTLSRC